MISQEIGDYSLFFLHINLIKHINLSLNVRNKIKQTSKLKVHIETAEAVKIIEGKFITLMRTDKI